MKAGQHVVLHAERGEHAGLLERADDAPPRDRGGPEPRQRGAVVRDAAAAGPEIAGDRVEGGGLAGAVGTDDARERFVRGAVTPPNLTARSLTASINVEPAARARARCRAAGRRRAGPAARRTRASATATTRPRAVPRAAR